MIAEVSKTVRFTDPEWARFKRLIGLKYTQNWADVVKRSLVLFEDQCITDGLLRTFDPATEPTQPQLFHLAEVNDVAQVEQPTFVVFSRQKCERCKRDKLVNLNLLCEPCQLVEDSNGQLTTADKLPTSSPATSSETVHTPRGRRKPKPSPVPTPAAPRPKPSANGKASAKKPASKKGVKA